MKRALNILLLAVALMTSSVQAVSAAAIENQFHSPQTGVEKALDSILKISDGNYTMLEDVQVYLRSGMSEDFKYSRMFTKPYLQSWAAGQEKWLKDMCKGLDKNDPYHDCRYLPPSCVRDANYPYVYRTEKPGKDETLISYTWPGAQEGYATYKMIKNKNGWVLDGADCGDPDIYNMKPYPRH
jgi:hypothetical protein